MLTYHVGMNNRPVCGLSLEAKSHPFDIFIIIIIKRGATVQEKMGISETTVKLEKKLHTDWLQCDTWSLSLQEEQRLTVFENTALS
jgi:hypothetical protein